MRPSPPALVAGRIRAVVFDLDGTLVDSYAAIRASLNHARAAHGLPELSVAEVRRAVGHGLEALIARFVGPECVADGVRLFRAEYARALVSGTVPCTGTVRVLAELDARGYRLAVASNKPAAFSVRILTNLGMHGYLGAVLGPEPPVLPKPDPSMLRACFVALGVEADEALYVGDMVLDVETAARAGVAVLLVPGGSSEASDLRGTGQHVLASLEGILSILPGRPGLGS